MSDWASPKPDPKGGVAPSTTRVANLAQHLTRNARRLGDSLALVYGSDRWTWAELDV